MEKGGSVGRTRPHSAQGLAVPAGWPGPAAVTPSPAWEPLLPPRWVLAGLAAASRHRVGPSGAPGETWSASSPAPLHGASARCCGERPGEHGAPRTAQPKPPARPGAAPSTRHLREDVPEDGRPDFLMVREEGGTGACVPRAGTSSCARLCPWSSVPGPPLPPPQASHFLPVPPQSSYPIWEDFNSKATKLHSQLR